MTVYMRSRITQNVKEEKKNLWEEKTKIER